jgi:hypothetical protein
MIKEKFTFFGLDKDWSNVFIITVFSKLGRPVKHIFFRPRTGLASSCECACPHCRQFSEKFFRVWKPELSNTMFPIILVAYLGFL